MKSELRWHSDGSVEADAHPIFCAVREDDDVKELDTSPISIGNVSAYKHSDVNEERRNDDFVVETNLRVFTTENRKFIDEGIVNSF